jgi:hypothetical protein
MKVAIRQGIIRAVPPFLQYNSGPGTVTLNATALTPCIVTAAHHTANYLIEETKTTPNAWGGGNGPGAPAYWSPTSEVTKGENNDVVSGTTTKKHLFWDINLATGELTRGWTPLLPVYGSSEPPAPLHGQHWFDVTNNVMKVWVKHSPTAMGVWQERIRVFAAVWDPAASGHIDYATYPVNQSQVAIPPGNFAAGNIIFGANGRPLKNGSMLVTTEDELIVANTTGQNVKFDAAIVFSTAQEEIPAFSCVSFTPQRKIKLASSLDATSFVSGIVVDHLFENDTGQVITNGLVRNDQWATTQLAGGGYLKDNINAPLFIDASGQLTLQVPPTGFIQQVGFVYDDTSIYFNLFPSILIQV